MQHTKTCNHCQETYLASKKNQKYCSNSCRVTACYDRNEYKYKSGYVQNEVIPKVEEKFELGGLETIEKQTQEPTMNIGGAFIGSGLAIAAEHVLKSLVPEEDKPLTLKQSKELTKQLMELIYKHDKLILSKLNDIMKEVKNGQKKQNGFNLLWITTKSIYMNY